MRYTTAGGFIQRQGARAALENSLCVGAAREAISGSVSTAAAGGAEKFLPRTT